MSTQCGIWIDGKKAILVHVSEDGESLDEIPSGIETRSEYFHEGDKGSFMGSHHLNQERKFGERKRNQIRHFVDKVIEKARSADQILLMGPAGMKVRVRTALCKDPKLVSKLCATKTLGPVSEAQLKSRVRSFFEAAGK